MPVDADGLPISEAEAVETMREETAAQFLLEQLARMEFDCPGALFVLGRAIAKTAVCVPGHDKLLPRVYEYIDACATMEKKFDAHRH